MSQERIVSEETLASPGCIAAAPSLEDTESLYAELEPFLQAQAPRSCPLDLMAWLERAKGHLGESENGLSVWGEKVCMQIFDVMVKNSDLVSVEIAQWIRTVHGVFDGLRSEKPVVDDPL